MLIGAMTSTFWFVLLMQLVKAQSTEMSNQQVLQSGVGSDITEEEAAQALRDYGVESFKTIVYSSKTPTCSLDNLPASTVGQLFTFCQVNAKKRSCMSVKRPENASGEAASQPLFLYDCKNTTCSERLTQEESSCVLLPSSGSFASAPTSNASSGTCPSIPGISPEMMDNDSVRFTPPFLRGVGRTNSLFDCILGNPKGSRHFSDVSCVRGLYELENFIELGRSLVQQGDPFQCIWDGRCSGEEGCCERGALISALFICYVPGNGTLSPSISAPIASGRWLQWLPLACIFLGYMMV